MNLKLWRLPALATLLCCSWVAVQGADLLIMDIDTKFDEQKVMPNGGYTFRFYQRIGKVKVYKNSPETLVWQTPGNNPQVNSPQKYVLRMQSDGNLCMYSPANRPVWANNVLGADQKLYLKEDGHLVVKKGEKPVWTSK
jgi:hypothetical protein